MVSCFLSGDFILSDVKATTCLLFWTHRVSVPFSLLEFFDHLCVMLFLSLPLNLNDLLPTINPPMLTQKLPFPFLNRAPGTTAEV